MAKKKTKSKAKKKSKLKKYMLTIHHEVTQYRYVHASSLKAAEKKWFDGKCYDDWYQLDEVFIRDELLGVEEAK